MNGRSVTLKRFLLCFVLIVVLGCARSVEPSIDNINTIFASKDFTFEFHPHHQSKKSISFRSDYLVFKSDQPTYRREIEYEEVLLINDYIQKIVDLHSSDLSTETSSYYVIKNTAYKVIIVPQQEDYYFDALLKTLKLDQIQ
ncbi:hypothetical protein [Aquimarina algicola]|uniref:Lipoprotein n=1 Tax=Aquimarina algicola TaxID=2589995 RepID=A0A504JHW9_9FLAO|nr:hypothetical protein [Aquimarina algicola]TPN88005.1 hypothetical protein FHK87_10560 [Aquimarina algicola]